VYEKIIPDGNRARTSHPIALPSLYQLWYQYPDCYNFLEFNGFGSETVSHAKPITSNQVTEAGRRRDMGYAYVPDQSTSMGERSFSDDNTRYH
jgi:hypothetical protein